MKKTLLFLASLLISGSATSQTIAQKPVQCGSFVEVAQMAEQYGEIPILRANANLMTQQGYIQGKLIMSFNKETQSYTVIEVYNENFACVIAAGTKLEFLIFQNSDNKTLDMYPKHGVRY